MENSPTQAWTVRFFLEELPTASRDWTKAAHRTVMLLLSVSVTTLCHNWPGAQRCLHRAGEPGAP